MNQVLSLLQAARNSAEPGTTLYSDHMLAELAALHEEMIAQLLLPRLSGAGTPAFIKSMTAQHERAAASLRSQLKCHQAERSGEHTNAALRNAYAA